MRFYLLTLGCPKNTVDSEGISRLLQQAGHETTTELQSAQLLIVNTCGFIDKAKEESFAALRELAELKQPGQFLIAAGCLSQRYGRELATKVPGLDGVIGTRRWMEITTLVQDLRSEAFAPGMGMGRGRGLGGGIRRMCLKAGEQTSSDEELSRLKKQIKDLNENMKQIIDRIDELKKD